MTMSKNEFLDTVKKSRILSPEQLNRWFENESTDGVLIANQMVRQDVLTEWQAKYLLAGRYQLELGGYLLLQRINRDDLGDRFLAVHKQLGRKVDIQVFPAALTNDTASLRTFIDRVSQTSTLDHPHLSHVYDIDQAGGRYYLVTEHVDGNHLAEIADDKIDETMLATWLLQTLDGLNHAHANGIVHGNLTITDLVVNREDGLKILNLATTELRKSDRQTRAATAADDFQALARIIGELLDRLPNSDRINGLSELRAIAGELGRGANSQIVARINQQLAVWLAKFAVLNDGRMPDVQLDGIDEPDRDGTDEFVSTTPSAQSRMISQANKSSIEDVKYDDEVDDSPSRFFAKMALENPVGLLSSVFVIGLLLAGATTYGILGALPDRTLAQATPEQSDVPDTPVTKKIAPTTRRQTNQIKLETTLTSQSEPSEPEANAPSVSDHNKTMERELESNDENLQTLAPSSQSLAQASEVVDVDIQPSPATPATETIEPTPFEPESLETKVESTASSTSEPAATAGLTNEELEKRSEAPFSYLPKFLSLPEIDEITEVKLGDVFIPSRYLMGAELVVSPGIASLKIHFEAERDPDNNQRWLINMGRTPNDKKTAVAMLRKESHELFFQWLPDAKKNRQAGYLKNVLLKLFIPDHSSILALRQPIAIEPLSLSPEALSATTVFELDYLPNPEVLLIELLPVKIEDTRLSPSVIDLAGIPGRVLLKREDNNALVWVNIGIDLKAKVRLRADLVVSDDTRILPLKNLRELQTLATNWKQQELILTQQHQIADDTRAPSGKSEEKRAFVSDLSRSKNHAKTRATKLQEYSDLAPKMMNQPYGIRIVARYDGLEVELACTKFEN